MKKSCTGKPLSIAIGAALVGSTALTGTATAAENPFSVSELSSGYIQLAEAKCGEGKCGGKSAEGKCGEGKCGESKSKGISVLEGKCGEGKCGTVRVRQMMDTNADGMISKQEYIDWSVKLAEKEFEQYDADHDNVLSPDELFKRISADD